MNIAVRYTSRSGNTKKLAEAIAKAAGVEAKDCSVAIEQPVDLLFLGGSIYAGGVDNALKQCIDGLDPQQVKCAAAFATSAMKKEPEKEIEKLLREKNIAVANRGFHCKGAFAFFHKGHPDAQDLEQAAAFAAALVKEMQDKG